MKQIEYQRVVKKYTLGLSTLTEITSCMSWITLVKKFQTQSSVYLEAITSYISTWAKPWTFVAGSLVQLCVVSVH